MRILLIAYDFRPQLGGVATCGFELATALADLEGVEDIQTQHVAEALQYRSKNE